MRAGILRACVPACLRACVPGRLPGRLGAWAPASLPQPACGPPAEVLEQLLWLLRCDPMSPTLWSSIDKTVAKYGPGTLRGGADLNIGATDPPKGDTPLWMACNTTNGSIHTRPTGFGPNAEYYRPSEITNMLTSSGWFHHDGSTKPLSHKDALAMVWGSIGRGYSFIGNAPPVSTLWPSDLI